MPTVPDHTRDDEAVEVDVEHSTDDNEDLLNESFTVPDADDSADPTGVDAEQKPEIEERSLLEDPLSQTMTDEQPVTYHHQPTGSKFGKPLVVATDGYAYSFLKELKRGGTVWRCSVRSKLCKCQAKVMGKGGDYRRNKTAHSHAADPSLLHKKKLDLKVKDEASRHQFPSAWDIEKTAMSDRGQLPNLPLVSTMQGKVNRQRQSLPPETPTDLNFELQDDEIPTVPDHTCEDEAMEVDVDNEDLLNECFTVPDADDSADPNGVDAEQKPEIEERSLLEDPLSQTMTDEQPVTYHHQPTGSKFGKPLVVATDGYAYSFLKELKRGGTVWRCSVRSKLCKCQAKVMGKGGDYRRNKTAHSHAADPSLLHKKKLDLKVKDEASRHQFPSAWDIEKTAMSDRGQLPNLPLVSTMQGKVNRQRQSLPPETPTDLNFELQDDEIPTVPDHTCEDEAMEVDVDNEDLLNECFTVPDADDSADPNGVDAEQKPEIEERSLLEDPLSQTMTDEQPVTYHHQPTGSKFGKPLVVATDGYAYSFLKELKRGGTVWRCSVRSKWCKCQAKVMGKGADYRRNKTAHCHAADPSLLHKKKLDLKVKDEASRHLFRSAGDILKTAMSDRGQLPNLPLASTMQRKVNRQRQRLRPKTPNDLNFEVNHEYLNSAEFIVGDIRVDDQRHIMFSTPHQLYILRQTKRWFVDGTFKVVDRPFCGGQLMSIHGFVRLNERIKQVPLMFVLMSHRRKEDYVAVLLKTKELLGDSISIEGIVLDFEAAAWSAVQEVFPDLQIKGCVFHWSQSVFRHVQSLGLGPAYMKCGSVQNYICQLLVLPFLPANHIRPVFEQLEARADSEALKQLIHYIRTTWIESTVFTVENWCVYMLRVRTNNDVEGWHNRLKGDCGQQALPFYKLVPALRKQSEGVEIDVKQLVEHGVRRSQRPESRNIDKKIFKLWEKHENKTISDTALLKGISRVYGPAKYTV